MENIQRDPTQERDALVAVLAKLVGRDVNALTREHGVGGLTAMPAELNEAIEVLRGYRPDHPVFVVLRNAPKFGV